MLETRSERIAPQSVFLLRMLGSLGIVLVVVAVLMGVGTAGYRHDCEIGWIERSEFSLQRIRAQNLQQTC